MILFLLIVRKYLILVHLSSSKARESINKDLDYDLLLDKEVKDYIIKNNLKF